MALIKDRLQVADLMQSKGNSSGKTRPRRLLLCLDGVPREVIQAALP